MSASAPPKYVYKIVPGSLPSSLPRELPLSKLDRADGFVHLSTAEQVNLSPPPFLSLSPLEHLWGCAAWARYSEEFELF